MKGFWRLLKYLKNYKRNVILNISCNILMAFFTVVSIPAIIPFLQILFDRTPKVLVKPASNYSIGGLVETIKYYFSHLIETSGKETALIYTCVIIILLYLLRNLFRYLSLFFMAPVRNGIVRDIRQDLFSKMMVLPLSYFSDERKGDLLSRMSGDVQEIEWSILNVLEAVFRGPVIIIGCLTFMLYTSPSLTVFVFGLILFTVLIIGGISKTLKRQSSQAQGRLGNLMAIIEEGLSGLRIVKGFNAEKYQANKFEKENNAYRDLLTRILWRRDLSSPLSEFLGIVVVAILLWYGSKQVFSGALLAETFFSFLLAFFYVIEPSKAFSSAYYNIQKGLAAVDRVDEIMNADLAVKDNENAIAINSFKESIIYKKVNFNYKNDDRPILQDIDLNISAGQVIALVGASGAGKSTLVDLLPRFYNVTSGEILIDGININNIKQKVLRSLMGIVSQEAILFNDSIYNNIVFGQTEVTKEMVEAAARIANAHEFIMDTENAYDTNIGDRGTKLSGGQRQRLTIARAILKNPPILILDEATSSLDSESEKLVQDALLKVMKNRTSIVIAHRLSTIQHADEIIVLQDGLIIERGNHNSLIKKEGAYSKLVELQAF